MGWDSFTNGLSNAGDGLTDGLSDSWTWLIGAGNTRTNAPVSDYEYADLSNESYEDLEVGTTLRSNNEMWEVIHIHDDKFVTGAASFTFQNEDGEVVMAFRGTESIDTPDRFVKDWAENINDTVFGRQSWQEMSLQIAFNEVTNLDNVDPDKISFTGHSQGGKHAQSFSLQNDLPAVTFNAPGINATNSTNILNPRAQIDNLGNYYNEWRNDAKIVNHVIEGDTVGEMGGILEKQIILNTMAMRAPMA